MKTISLLNLVLSLLATPAAFAQVSPQGSVESHLHNIVDRVRQCSMLPFTLKADGQKVYHALVSHCPEVRVYPNGIAKVRVGAHTYSATLVESVDSDGDFYHVQIQDLASKDIAQLNNIPAYGDVLLAILSGDIRTIPQVYVSANDASLAPWLDQYLVRKHY